MSTTDPDVARIQRLLKQIYRISEHASLTGAFANGGQDAVEKYNMILDRLNQKGFDLGDLFPPLPADASFERVGVAAKLLSAYIADEEAERWQNSTPNIVIGNLGSLAELEKLKDLDKVIKESLPDWLRDKVKVSTDEGAEESEAQTVKVSEQSIPMPDFTRSSG